MTTRIRFDGQPHHLLDLGTHGDPSVINGGQASNVDDDFAQELIDAPWADVTVIPPAAAVWPKANAKLDELAERLGVTWPEPEDGKKLTAAEKIAALEEAGHTPDSVYQAGDAAPNDTAGDQPAGEGDPATLDEETR